MLVTLPLERHCRFSFLEAPSPVQKKTLKLSDKLSDVNLICGDIFIMIKAITQQGANWLITRAFVYS